MSPPIVKTNPNGMIINKQDPYTHVVNSMGSHAEQKQAGIMEEQSQYGGKPKRKHKKSTTKKNADKQREKKIKYVYTLRRFGI